jgi:hypothetical protein
MVTPTDGKGPPWVHDGQIKEFPQEMVMLGRCTVIIKVSATPSDGPGGLLVAAPKSSHRLAWLPCDT